ncbi:hypothetical protein TCAL_07653 [Tigriopus californicus]|uniref:Uncharacterized protein n=1 Tax=Tigriopus californicus TaxID=6832 RepID=A0A553NNC0_TIGCA|nr:glutathione S-transferase 1-1-like [Tigriopus californicus]TRY66938.1 hypothetical protein TCAL_07653 [Tigriopus californicus]
MVLQFYSAQPSSPCRLVHMVLETIGVPYQLNSVNLAQGEHLASEFLAINPFHNVPFIVDEDLSMGESRAIATYLANKYDESGQLYPKDPKTRAIVDQRLFFDMGSLFASHRSCYHSKMMKGIEPPKKDLERAHQSLLWAEDMIRATGYAAGTQNLTLADLAFVATFSTIQATEAFDLSDLPIWKEYFPRITKLIKNYDEVNGKGALMFGAFYQAQLKGAISQEC